MLIFLTMLSCSAQNSPRLSTEHFSQQLIADNMKERQQIEQVYRQMYQAMVEKDVETLNALHADNFVLIHMTGMHQNKQEYIQAIANGTLNYYEAAHEDMDITVDGDEATLVGRSRVTAAVFGGGRHTWRLQLHFTLRKTGGRWQFTSSKASTY